MEEFSPPRSLTQLNLKFTFLALLCETQRVSVTRYAYKVGKRRNGRLSINLQQANNMAEAASKNSANEENMQCETEIRKRAKQ